MGDDRAERGGGGQAPRAVLVPDRPAGYYFRPNQDLRRFGKHIRYNQYSQRSDPVAPIREKGVDRILLVGDSVLNGGAITDQADTIGELLKSRLQTTGRRVEVLAASAGGWNIENRLGYLQRFGILQSQIVILQIGSEDLPQSKNKLDPRDPNMPTANPPLALTEVWVRYCWPRLRGLLTPDSAQPPVERGASEAGRKQFERNAQAFRETVALIRDQQGATMLLYNPMRSEMTPPRHDSPLQTDFFSVVNEQQVPIIDLGKRWTALAPDTVAGFYRDEHHFSVAGNRAAADALSSVLLNMPPAVE